MFSSKDAPRAPLVANVCNRCANSSRHRRWGVRIADSCAHGRHEIQRRALQGAPSGPRTVRGNSAPRRTAPRRRTRLRVRHRARQGTPCRDRAHTLAGQGLSRRVARAASRPPRPARAGGIPVKRRSGHGVADGGIRPPRGHRRGGERRGGQSAGSAGHRRPQRRAPVAGFRGRLGAPHR